MPKNLSKVALSLLLKLQMPNKCLCKHLQNTTNPGQESLSHSSPKWQYFIFTNILRSRTFIDTDNHFLTMLLAKISPSIHATLFPSPNTHMKRAGFTLLPLPEHTSGTISQNRIATLICSHWAAILLITGKPWQRHSLCNGSAQSNNTQQGKHMYIFLPESSYKILSFTCSYLKIPDLMNSMKAQQQTIKEEKQLLC